MRNHSNKMQATRQPIFNVTSGHENRIYIDTPVSCNLVQVHTTSVHCLIDMRKPIHHILGQHQVALAVTDDLG